MNLRYKLYPAAVITPVVLATLLYTGMTYSYDGDIDYLAPYVTLNPASGKLITVDPRKDAAVAAKLEQQHNASNPNANASSATPASNSAPVTNATGATSTSSTVSAPADMEQTPSPATSSNATVIAIGMLVIIGLIVAFTRRKSGNSAGTTTDN